MINEENPKLRRYLTKEIEKIEKYYFNIAMEDDEYSEVYEAKLEDLPPMMSEGSELRKSLVAVKLKGVDNIASPVYTQQVMWDWDMDTDGMEEINIHDGKSMMIKEIATVMGWDDLTKQANECIYND